MKTFHLDQLGRDVSRLVLGTMVFTRAPRELTFDMLDMFCTRNHDRAGKHLGIGTAMEGRFEKRSLANKRQEGFRHRLPASRPEPSAASAT